MKATLIINNKELEIEISKSELEKLQAAPKEHTGYERVSEKENNALYYACSNGGVEWVQNFYDDFATDYYNTANYYSSLSVAENNARTDQLMRQLRRFSVEHRERGVNFNNVDTQKYYIYYDYESNELGLAITYSAKRFGTIYFDSEEAIRAAIDEFHDELIWYFIEYKDSL